MKSTDIIDIGDFISYKDHKMAVLDFDYENEYVYVFCNDDQRCRRFPMKKLDKMKIEKKAACKSIIRAFFDDMTYMR